MRLGRRPWAGQDTASVLGRCATRPARARGAYRAFVGAGIPQGRRPELPGGGLLRRRGGWAAVRALRRGREQYAADDRVLGRSAFVEARQRAIAARPAARRPTLPLHALVTRGCAAVHLAPTALQEGSRRTAICRARAGIAYLALDVGGYPAPRLVSVLGVRPPSIHTAAQRGRADRARWDRVWDSGKK